QEQDLDKALEEVREGIQKLKHEQDLFTTPKKLPKSQSAPPTQSDIEIKQGVTPPSPKIKKIHSARKLGDNYDGPSFFQTLETQRSPAKRSFSTEYSANHTAALALQPLDAHPREYGMSDADLESIKDDHKKLLSALEFPANPYYEDKKIS